MVRHLSVIGSVPWTLGLTRAILPGNMKCLVVAVALECSYSCLFILSNKGTIVARNRFELGERILNRELLRK